MSIRYNTDDLEQRIKNLNDIIKSAEQEKDMLKTKLTLQDIANFHEWLDRDYTGIRRIVLSASIKNPSGIPVALPNQGMALIEDMDEKWGVGLRWEDDSTVQLDIELFQAAFEEMAINAAVLDNAKQPPLYGIINATTRAAFTSEKFPLDHPDFSEDWRLCYYGMDKKEALKACMLSKWY